MEFLKKILSVNVEDTYPSYYADLMAGDFTAAIPGIKAACAQGDALAMLVLSNMLLTGQGIEQNGAESLLWLRQSAVHGHPHAMCWLGQHLAEAMPGAGRDDSQAAYWLFQAAKRGITEATHTLGRLALRNPSVIGEHFTKEELYSLIREAHRPRRQGVGSGAARAVL